MRFSGIFLDFDGVISRNSFELMIGWAHSYMCQFSYIEERTIREIAKITIAFPPEAVLELLLRSFGIPGNVKEVQQLMLKAVSDSILIEQTFYEIIDFCQKEGIQVKILSLNYLNQIQGLDTSMIYSTLGMSKADPACYNQIASTLQINLSDWLIVDDSPYALRAAKIAGLKTAVMISPLFNMDDYLEYQSMIDVKLWSLHDLIKILDPMCM